MYLSANICLPFPKKYISAVHKAWRTVNVRSLCLNTVYLCFVLLYFNMWRNSAAVKPGRREVKLLASESLSKA